MMALNVCGDSRIDNRNNLYCFVLTLDKLLSLNFYSFFFSCVLGFLLELLNDLNQILNSNLVHMHNITQAKLESGLGLR